MATGWNAWTHMQEVRACRPCVSERPSACVHSGDTEWVAEKPLFRNLNRIEGLKARQPLCQSQALLFHKTSIGLLQVRQGTRQRFQEFVTFTAAQSQAARDRKFHRS